MAGLTTTERGYGWSHEKVRAQLMADHVDGSPCWWCGLPVFREKTANWDGESLHADHSEERARDGGDADRLLHGICNKQRGGGSRDDQRPAVTGVAMDERMPDVVVSPEDESLDIGTTWFDWPEMA
ncbi:hypothetical protein [Rhodococcus sp. IEGM 1330]|uniref:hypothetical protein n=1 Tax=Rhodococcus sp. IEGM 1330 TaxID=3082225 RepID=UPI0029536CA0|nr:hypothetical protein [Rhodococcus sp. IEGM 1330]MDV8022283.1 hypothetical protein [Rhodococcus sp. IEGM 1330]